MQYIQIFIPDRGLIACAEFCFCPSTSRRTTPCIALWACVFFGPYAEYSKRLALLAVMRCGILKLGKALAAFVEKQNAANRPWDVQYYPVTYRKLQYGDCEECSSALALGRWPTVVACWRLVAGLQYSSSTVGQGCRQLQSNLPIQIYANVRKFAACASSNYSTPQYMGYCLQ